MIKRPSPFFVEEKPANDVVEMFSRFFDKNTFNLGRAQKPTSKPAPQIADWEWEAELKRHGVC